VAPGWVLVKLARRAGAARWDRIDAPGLGVEVDEAKLARYRQAHLDHGEFPPYGDGPDRTDGERMVRIAGRLGFEAVPHITVLRFAEAQG
jgi:hypothetical protein